MSARVFIIILHAVLIRCVTVTVREPTEINSQSKVELTPILITSGLNDIAVLSAPILNARAIYYLHRPNGDALRLNFEDDKADKKFSSNDIEHRQYRIFNANFNRTCCDPELEKVGTEVTRNFMIGPLQAEDHGNWVLSAYFKDLDEHWIELFQVITVEIIETVPLSAEMSELSIGDTFVLSFAYPLVNLESCEIVPPPSTTDRFYDRTNTGLDKCEFVMENVTSEDEGTWRIIGVGPIVYKGSTDLRVRNPIKFVS